MQVTKDSEKYWLGNSRSIGQAIGESIGRSINESMAPIQGKAWVGTSELVGMQGVIIYMIKILSLRKMKRVCRTEGTLGNIRDQIMSSTRVDAIEQNFLEKAPILYCRLQG